jgi:hypothetical protein
MIPRELIKFRLIKFIVALGISLFLTYFTACRSTCDDYKQTCDSSLGDPVCFAMLLVVYFITVWVVYSLILGLKNKS